MAMQCEGLTVKTRPALTSPQSALQMRYRTLWGRGLLGRWCNVWTTAGKSLHPIVKVGEKCQSQFLRFVSPHTEEAFKWL